ncbi:MAG: hypothetical protein ACRC54_03605 [Fusobacteriaceae bacterium]
MLEKQVKKNGVFTNLISLSNLLETEIRKLSKELHVNHLELSILVNISQKETTQYKLSKKYSTSIQRMHQITKKFIRNGYITTSEEFEKGRTLKKLLINSEMEKKLSQVNSRIIKKLKSKKITYENLSELEDALEIILGKFNGKSE